MSAPLTREAVLDYQRLLRLDGLYLGALDGLWGPQTEDADQGRGSQLLALVDDLPFDHRTIAVLRTLILPAADAAVSHLYLLAEWWCESKLAAKLLSGYRSYAEQQAIWEQGRTKPGPIVTNARPGRSRHNFGIAWDIGLFRADGSYVTDEGLYIEAAKAAKGSLSWGGNWTTFKDYPHYELPSRLHTAELRRRYEAGTLRL